MKHSTNKMAFSATLHCLLGCSIGEVAGMLLGVGFGWSNVTTVAVSVALAFTSGYSLSLLPVVRGGVAFKHAIRLVFAADTLSVATMELVDNVVMVVWPGAMNAGLNNYIFWVSMPVSLLAAFVIAFPVNRYLLAWGKGHALIHDMHESHDEHSNHH